MASTSAARAGDGVSRIRSAAATLATDNQLITDIRRAISTMKEVAVEMEKLNRTHEVKQLENAVVELLNTTEECTYFSEVMHSIANNYQLGPQLTNFEKKFEDEVSKLKGSSSSNHQNHHLLRQFREAVWQVHHAGQPMPDEEQDGIVMTSTHGSLKNTACPISGKSISALSEPVRSMDCKHIYDKKSVMHYIKTNGQRVKCPIAGCGNILVANKVLCDPLLLVEIEEFCSMSKEATMNDAIEDFTALG